MREMRNSGIEWIGQIPKQWKVAKLKYGLTQNDGGVWGNDPTESELDKVVLRSTEQTIDGKWNIVEPAQRFLGKYVSANLRICKNDLLITKSSGSSLHIGKTTLADGYFECNECYYSNFLQRLRTDERLNPKYLWYLLNNPIAREQFVWLQNSTIGIGNINSEDINNLFVPYPPLVEQDAVANFLDAKCAEIDTLMADIQAQIETLEQYKRSVITESVTKGLDPNVEMKDSGIEWVGKIPFTWNISNIGGMYSLRNEKVSDRDYPPLSVTKQGVLPQLENVAKTDAHDDRKLVRVGDFAINSRSDRRGSCGISAYNGSVSLINTVLCPRNEMNPRYYNWLFHTAEFADEFYKQGHGIVDDLWTTRWQDMKRIQVPHPSLEEQETIANFLDDKCSEIDACISTKKEQLSTLEAYKKSLIYEYVTGKKEGPEYVV